MIEKWIVWGDWRMSKSTATIGRERAASTLVALALTALACAPDTALGPPSRNSIRDASADRETGLVVTPIIPAGDPYPYGQATAINEAGVVAGWRVDYPGTSYAFTWKDGVMTNLGSFFVPVAINRSGDILSAAGIWRNGVMTPLGNLPGAANCIGTDMNDKAQVVGSCYVIAPDVPTRAFIWDNGVMTELGTLGGSMAGAEGINNRGEVVGYSTLAGDGATHAFLWKDGVMTDLGTMGGPSSKAFAINNLGQIAGLSDTYVDHPTCWSYDGFRPMMPVIWRRGTWTPLHTESGFEYYCKEFRRIEDLSDAGHVVGEYLGAPDFIGFVWHDGVELDLGMNAGTFALSVNSSGQIVGYETSSVFMHAALLWSVGKHGP